ncbi:MAG: hypothetical protein LBP53_05080 [Candidatus Peribacteria bacterium]|jgi:hypothetical protein|nr:hypothetical protein [Candidatus Peribacteria bacterium]
MNRTEDPFLKNTYVLYTTLGNQIQKETTFFPNKIILKYNRFPYEATKENQFLHKEFADEEKGIKQAFPELSEREIAEEISPI